MSVSYFFYLTFFCRSDSCVARFRKWIIPRLTFIVENHQIKKQEDLVMKMARYIFILYLFHQWSLPGMYTDMNGWYCNVLSFSIRFIFFHGFFDVKKPTPEVPETVQAFSVPIDQQTRATLSAAFYRSEFSASPYMFY